MAIPIVSKFPARDLRGADIPPHQEVGFWMLTRIDWNTGCWNWIGMTAGIKGFHYGRFKIGGTKYSANRVAYAICYGYVGRKDFVRHTCDNPSCVNPTHLLLGTPKENTADMIERGRKPRGAAVGKLTEAQALEVIATIGTETAEAIAERFGNVVKATTIKKIRAGKNWKHLDVNKARRLAGWMEVN